MHSVYTRTLAVALAVAVLALLAALAWGAAASVEVSERFTPDRLGASANLALTARFHSPPGGTPPPVRKLTVYAPAGMLIDPRGAGVCSQAVLEQRGPGACPADSRAGFGGGVGVLQLPGETVHESYTLDFFFSSTRPGRLSLLVYASARAPINVELIVIAREVRAPAPYGLGFSVEVPPISTIPGAPLASIESAFASLGAADVAYDKRVHGHLRVVRVRGLVVPRHCPTGGFYSRATIEFRNGEALTIVPRVPCPAR